MPVGRTELRGPRMTIFELVKVALDELYRESQSVYGQGVDAEIAQKIEYLAQSYRSLNSAERSPVDYSDPATRFAYVYKYVAAHGDYLVQVLAQLRSTLHRPIFGQQKVRVSCVGGGPGSDIIAVLKYIDEQNGQEGVDKLTCYLLDREQAWADTWTELDDRMNVGVQLNANFQPLDVTNPGSWRSQRKFLSADLFTMSYFLSEVRALDDNGVVGDFWRELFAGAKGGALFVYTDNAHDYFTSYFDGLWKSSGLEPLIEAVDNSFLPRFSEQASELAFYRAKFGQSPKLRSQLAYRVLKKP